MKKLQSHLQKCYATKVKMLKPIGVNHFKIKINSFFKWISPSQ